MLGFAGVVGIVGVEVHPATEGQVDVVIRKLEWAKRCLARELAAGHAVRRWYWIASGASALSKTTSEYRRLASSGVEYVGRMLRKRNIA